MSSRAVISPFPSLSEPTLREASGEFSPLEKAERYRRHKSEQCASAAKDMTQNTTPPLRGVAFVPFSVLRTSCRPAKGSQIEFFWAATRASCTLESDLLPDRVAAVVPIEKAYVRHWSSVTALMPFGMCLSRRRRAAFLNRLLERAKAIWAPLGSFAPLAAPSSRRRHRRDDDARPDRLIVFVPSDLDGHQPTDDFRSGLAVLRKFERRDDVFGRVALDGYLRVDGADQRRMSARPLAVVAAKCTMTTAQSKASRIASAART